MDAHQHAALTRLFAANRLDPSVPEHAIFIAGELAKLKITDKHDYETKKAFYDQKLKEWEETPDDPIDTRDVVEQHTHFNNLPLPELPVEEVVKEKEIIVEPKKAKGRPKSK